MATNAELRAELNKRRRADGTGGGTRKGAKPAGPVPAGGYSLANLEDMWAALSDRDPVKADEQLKSIAKKQEAGEGRWYEPIRSGLRGAMGDVGDTLGAGIAAGAQKLTGAEGSFGDIYSDIKGSIDAEEVAYAQANPETDAMARNIGTGLAALTGAAGLARAGGSQLAKQGLSKAVQATKGRSSGLGAAFNTPSVGARVARSARRMGSKAASTGLPKAKGAASAIGRGASATLRAGGRGLKGAAKATGRGALRGAEGALLGGAAGALGVPGMDAKTGALMAFGLGGKMGSGLTKYMKKRLQKDWG